jgi:hypothetical protein
VSSLTHSLSFFHYLSTPLALGPVSGNDYLVLELLRPLDSVALAPFVIVRRVNLSSMLSVVGAIKDEADMLYTATVLDAPVPLRISQALVSRLCHHIVFGCYPSSYLLNPFACE